MILTRLYELAVRERLLADPAFEVQPVPFVVVLDEGGMFLGVEEQRGVVRKESKKKGSPPKEEPDKGVMRSIPRPHGNTASQGFARYFVDTLPRVLLTVHDLARITDEAKKQNEIEKRRRSFTTFWQQIDAAADATDDPALRAVQAFGGQLKEDGQLAERVRKAVAEKDPASGDRVTFAYHPHGGPTILEWRPLRQWYADFFQKFTAGKQTGGPVGFCTVTGTVGPLPASHPIKLTGIPGGLPTGVSIVSFDKPAFQHYGLDGAANAAVGYEAADGYARAFQWLRGRRDHHFVVGGTMYLFWTRQPADLSEVMALGEPDAGQVKQLLEGVARGKGANAIDDTNKFYLLAVSGNSARAVVRDYLERPLGQVRGAIRDWLADLRIADPSKDYQGRPNAAFPLWMLAVATAQESDRVAPDTHARLMHAALTGGPLPDSVLAACLGRLRAEGGGGFRAARMGLVRLCLNRNHFRGGDRMTETLNPDEMHPAYVYGRLLRVFEEIQREALGDVNATVVDKFYGTFSAAPALIFARLYSNAQNHLRKIRGENPGAAFNLDRRLAEVTGLLPPAPPAGTLPLADQGRFALGYYHQKARTFEEIAERRRAKAANAAAE
jgi:CRISPR-associated protein Csd1